MPTSTPPGSGPGNRAVTVVVVGSALVLVVGGVLAFRHREPSKQTDDEVSALLQRQTEELSRAAQTKEAAVLERYLDPAIVYTREDGTVGGKTDILGAPGLTSRGAISDFHCHVVGDVAVTSFLGEVAQPVGGQTLTFHRRATEAWHRDEQGNWRLVASETLTVPREPWAEALAPELLDDYVGEYRSGPDLSVAITREGNDLVTSSNGTPPEPLRAEAKDLFFVPGHLGTRRIFRRDAGGHVTGYVSRNAGGDLTLTKS